MCVDYLVFDASAGSDRKRATLAPWEGSRQYFRISHLPKSYRMLSRSATPAAAVDQITEYPTPEIDMLLSNAINSATHPETDERKGQHSSQDAVKPPQVLDRLPRHLDVHAPHPGHKVEGENNRTLRVSSFREIELRMLTQ